MEDTSSIAEDFQPPKLLTIDAPQKINFTDNADETLEFLQRFRGDVLSVEAAGNTLVVDLTHTLEISPEAALSLRSEVDQLSWLRAQTVCWLQPKSEQATRALNSAGFQWRASIVPTTRMEAIRGVLVAPQVISSGKSPVVHIQAERRLGGSSDDSIEHLTEHFEVILKKALQDLDEREYEFYRKPILTALYEIVYNVDIHAYSDEHSFEFAEQKRRRDFDWWIGVFGIGARGRVVSKNATELVVVAIDHGVSIPANIRAGLRSGEARVVKSNRLSRSPTATDAEPTETEMLEFLIDGKLLSVDRSSSGTGMANIREIVDDDIAYEMQIVSGKASSRHVNLAKDETRKESKLLGFSYPGTIISWKMKRKPELRDEPQT